MLFTLTSVPGSEYQFLHLANEMITVIQRKTVKNNINKAALKWNLSCHPRGTALYILRLKLWNVKRRQNNLWTGPRATFCLER